MRQTGYQYRILKMAVVIAITIAMITGCHKKETSFKIEEKSYATDIIMIYNNLDQYMGKKINLQGYLYEDSSTDTPVYYVVRDMYGFSCGDVRDVFGFEIRTDIELPEEEKWLDLTGYLETYTKEGHEVVFLNVIEFSVIQEPS